MPEERERVEAGFKLDTLIKTTLRHHARRLALKVAHFLVQSRVPGSSPAKRLAACNPEVRSALDDALRSTLADDWLAWPVQPLSAGMLWSVVEFVLLLLTCLR